MATGQLPAELTLVNAAIATDGGSIYLLSTDQAGGQIEFLLDRSVKNQMAGTMQLYVNSAPIPRSSPEESGWLALISDAAIRKANGLSTSGKRESSISNLATDFVDHVASEAYQKGHAPVEPPPPQDRLRTLVSEGKTLEVIKAYREAHPDVGIMAARAAVKTMATEVEAELALSNSAAPASRH